ncbi:MAG: 50S ribosomal protein L24 [Candidatus Altiarchaeales archaeon ex4484_96]|nr:MAG: 50S ribosomal protein L24 [Candidatus Altiarchaeales archaeon ex4484_96]
MKQTKSIKASKQRGYRAKAPLHKKMRFMGCRLEARLKDKYGRRTIPVRKGDTVKIMRGEFRGGSGEVTRVDLKKSCVYIDGVNIKKTDGTDVARPINPSNIMITDLTLDDKKRIAMLERGLKE